MGRRLALLIATYHYQDASLRRLAAPAHDAEALAEVLADPAVGHFEVTTLVNQPHHLVGAAIGDFYRDCRRDDLTLLYFTGHGLKDDAGRLFLAMTDTRRDNLEFTGLSAEQVDRAMAGTPSRQTVLVLDCCYSGAFPAGRVAKGDTEVHALERFGGRGRTVLTASDATQYSFEGDQLTGQATQSVFTRHLVAGLRDGSADLDRDGDVSLDELYRYVHEKVVEEMPRQRPKRQDNVEGRTVIARNPNWTLPDHLVSSLDSPIPDVRMAALGPLDELFRAGNELVRAQVLAQYSRLADDDSRRVADAARDRLSGTAPRVAPPPRPPEPRGPIAAKEGKAPKRVGRVGAVAAAIVAVAGATIGIVAALGDDGTGSPDGGPSSAAPVATGAPGLYGLAVSSDGRRLYAGNRERDTLSMIDTTTRKLVGQPIAVGDEPLGVAVSAGGKRGYAVNGNADSVWEIDTGTGKRVGAAIEVGRLPLGIVVHPTVARAFVVNRGSDNVSVIDTVRNKTIATIDVGDNPLHIAISRDGNRAYVTNRLSNSVTVLDTETNRPAGKPIAVAAEPQDLTISPDGGTLYVTHSGSTEVTVVDTGRGAARAERIRFPAPPWSIEASPDGRRLYATLLDSDQVAALDTGTGTAQTIRVGDAPSGLAVSPDGQRLYAANGAEGTISVVETAGNRVIGGITVPG